MINLAPNAAENEENVNNVIKPTSSLGDKHKQHFMQSGG